MKQKVTKKNILIICGIILAIIFVGSLFAGKYPLTLADIVEGQNQAVRVFLTLRLPRTIVAVAGGFTLAIAGMVYQLVFKNPLASPDIIGVSSGASAGAAFAILFLAGSPLVLTASAFIGSLVAVIIALAIASIAADRGNGTIVLSGLAVHSVAQTVLMTLKLTADPEKELASIEYWIMGSLNGVTLKDIPFTLIVTAICISILFLLYRHVLLLSVEEEEAALLGVPVHKMRIIVLMTATLAVAAVVSIMGIVSFVGLLAPHIARLLVKDSRVATLWLSGILGSIILCISDILARTIAPSELPVSIFTSLIGAPFLVYLLLKKENING